MVSWFSQGRTAFDHTNGIFRAALGPDYASNPMAAWAMHAYHAAYVSAVVIGVFILVLTVVILAWRLIQHLRTRSAGSRGESWSACGTLSMKWVCGPDGA